MTFGFFKASAAPALIGLKADRDTSVSLSLAVKPLPRGSFPSDCKHQSSSKIQYFFSKTGGAEGNRTPDLLNAIQALSQLSYNPECLR